MKESKAEKDFDGDDVKIEGEGYTFEKLPPIDVDPTTGCWIPRDPPRTEKGYVRVKFLGRNVRLHRFVYSLVCGGLRAGAVVRHRCDRRDCCNPLHLLSGTNADNVADREARGRGAKGERIGTAKLTNEQAIAIVTDGTRSPSEKAELHGVARSSIYAVLAGRTFRDVTAPYRDASKGIETPAAPR